MANNTLSPLEQDLLTEIFNLGVANASNSLSKMVGEEVKLSVPTVMFDSVENVASSIGKEQFISGVTQEIKGPFNAQSMLLFPEEGSIEVVSKMLGGALPQEVVVEMKQEALSEIGNIVLNACIGSVGQMLGDNFELDLPSYKMETAEHILVSDSHKAIDIVMFIHIEMTLSESNVTGYMAFLLESGSMEKLKQCLKSSLDAIQN
ncbi:MAG: chemotaxis protein CheX [Chromatiales bacterium]|nr:chemotaxis protein CheX [Chromatiales bacterium]